MNGDPERTLVHKAYRRAGCAQRASSGVSLRQPLAAGKQGSDVCNGLVVEGLEATRAAVLMASRNHGHGE